MTLTTRQKVLIPSLILVLAFLAWQVYKTFQVFDANPAGEANITSAPLATPAPKPVAMEQTASLVEAKAEPVQLSSDQKQYLQLVAQYQRLQMEKMIAANSQAIAEAKLKAAQAEAQLSQIGGQGEVKPEVAAIKPKLIPQDEYRLVYTGELQGHWSATLRKGKELIDVTKGDRIDDGSQVVSITNSRVVLQNGNQQKIVNFLGERDIVVTKSPQPALKQAKKSVAKQQQESKPQQLKQKQEKQQSAQQKAISKAIAMSMSTSFVNLNLPKAKEQKKNLNSELVEIPTFKTQAYKLALKPKLATNKSLFTADEIKILDLNPNLYTIQLIASYSHKNISDFIMDNNLVGRSLQFETKYHHRPWYALIYGQYKSLSQSLETISLMPEALSKHGAFARKVKIIQNEILKQKIG